MIENSYIGTIPKQNIHETKTGMFIIMVIPKYVFVYYIQFLKLTISIKKNPESGGVFIHSIHPF